jgi:hypothetical protein
MRTPLMILLALGLACSTTTETAQTTVSGKGAKGNGTAAGGQAGGAGGSGGSGGSGGAQGPGPGGESSGGIQHIQFQPAPDGAKVAFVSPLDGETVASPVTMKFSIDGMQLVPASDEVKMGQGHHHIIVDGSHVEETVEVPMNATHIHYGKAQSEASLELTPGAHTLTLQFADPRHRSYGQKLSQTISITVEGEAAPADDSTDQGGEPEAAAGGE